MFLHQSAPLSPILWDIQSAHAASSHQFLYIFFRNLEFLTFVCYSASRAVDVRGSTGPTRLTGRRSLLSPRQTFDRNGRTRWPSCCIRLGVRSAWLLYLLCICRTWWSKVWTSCQALHSRESSGPVANWLWRTCTSALLSHLPSRFSFALFQNHIISLSIQFDPRIPFWFWLLHCRFCLLLISQLLLEEQRLP